jgi:multiple sugar transport system permease protein
MVRLMKTDKSLRVEDWTSLQIQGGSSRAPFMMAVAGQTAPDLYMAHFHSLNADMAQGFNYPLNEWIGDDTNHNGRIDENEAKWPGWKTIPALWRQVATRDGKVYGIPKSDVSYNAIVFRTDMVRQAGLDPDNPPKTWDEFMYWCQRLTIPGKIIPGAKVQRGQRGFALTRFCWLWLPWEQSVGGSPIRQIRRSPKTGKAYTFPMDETKFITPDTRENLSLVTPVWRASWDDTPAQQAMGFYHKLRWQHWVKDPQTREPLNLTPAQETAGMVTLASGRQVHFAPADVIKGVVRPYSGANPDESFMDWLARGEVAMIPWFFNDLTAYQKQSGINPELLSVFAVPAGPGGRPVVQIQRHFVAMTEGVGHRPQIERDAVWKVMQVLNSAESHDEQVRRMVTSGNARFVNPDDLVRLGYKGYLNEVPPALLRFYADIDAGRIMLKTEPFMGFWQGGALELDNNVTSLLISDAGEHFDYVAALHSSAAAANNGVMFARSEAEIKPHRPMAWAIFCLVAMVLMFFIAMIIKTNLQAQMTSKISSRAGVYKPWMPVLMLIPALGLVALWGYYPLLKGLVMAFQDFHIVGKHPWIGLDNFINIFLNPDFYKSISATLKFSIWSMLLVFTTPILLSLMLSEIPYGKVFWRSVFFLPQLSSGMVIALLWKQMYSPNETGLVNQLMAFLHQQPHDWLGDPRFAMVCTIIPTVWAGMGIASLIYLAALKGIPDELYEAASLDGGNFFDKLRYITFPQLAPLIIINFVGAFIATFQSMGNIFLLTFGGPGKETMVLGMSIWIEAYNNLRFSIATSMAWLMGSALVGFAYLQIRILRKVEFRRVEEV